MRSLMINIGNFLFKHRNFLFPLYALGLFLLFRPPVCGLHSPDPVEFYRMLLAVCLAGSGLAVRGVVIGLAYIKRGGLNRKVYADNLVTEGMFSVCRNPLYVGNMLIYAGEFLMFGNRWCALIGILSFWFIYECIIAAEEQYLRNKFGPAYDDYCHDVPRWLPRVAKLRAAFSGMRFDWRKVLFKDYSTICTTLAFLACIQLWEVLANHGYLERQSEVMSLIGGVFLMAITAFVVRWIKKSTASPNSAANTDAAVSAEGAEKAGL